MSGHVEHADGTRSDGTFPRHWGAPPSEGRASWLLRNIATDQALRRRGLDPVEVRTGKPNMSAVAAMARVLRARAIT